MPSRWLCLLILAFWLGFNGWLFCTDLLPRLLPGQPPPFTIDLVEEAQTKRPFIDWVVFRNGQKAFRARTRVENPEHDVFVLAADFTPLVGVQPVPVYGPLSLLKMSSRYEVDSAGNLLAVAVNFDGTALLGANFTAEIAGRVREGKLAPRLLLELAGREIRRTAPAVPVARGGSILMPLHPVNRLRGLSPGQRWRMIAYDPLVAAVNALQGKESEPQVLHARVRDEVEIYSQGRRQDVPCLVVEYTGDDLTASTRVGVDRGQVMSQEVKLHDDTWVMHRE